MKTTVNRSDFIDAFNRAGRGEQFTYGALGVLFDYIEQIEDSTGEEIEMDVIAICCEYSEATTDEVIEQYSIDIEDMDEEERDDAVREYLQEHTALAGETDAGAFVFAQF